MSETMNMDVAGSLFTSMYRNVKIKGQVPAAQNQEGTGSVSNPVAQYCIGLGMQNSTCGCLAKVPLGLIGAGNCLNKSLGTLVPP